ncbi:hypothetical protein BU17DRAFT_65213 [Hysterangium stoloniferum]|nr:hypothetical protein BU17DRAFT_65213 [Hysterangium stoloniferum]
MRHSVRGLDHKRGLLQIVLAIAFINQIVRGTTLWMAASGNHQVIIALSADTKVLQRRLWTFEVHLLCTAELDLSLAYIGVSTEKDWHRVVYGYDRKSSSAYMDTGIRHTGRIVTWNPL